MISEEEYKERLKVIAFGMSLVAVGKKVMDKALEELKSYEEKPSDNPLKSLPPDDYELGN